MADDAGPTTPPESSPTDQNETWPVEAMLYQFFFVLEAEDVAACCIGAESIQGSLSREVVRLQCLQCERVREAPSHQCEVII